MEETKILKPCFFIGRPCGRYLADEDLIQQKVLIILGETWAYRIQGPVESMEDKLDWVKNNIAIMAKFESQFRSRLGFINSRSFEKLQYPCERCDKTVTISDSYFVSIDECGDEDHNLLPECICKECGEAFDELKDENYHRSYFS